MLGILLMLAGSLPACRPALLYFSKPDGPPEYQLGWQDGCDSAVAAEGDVFQKLAAGFRKRPEFQPNVNYKSGWNEGFMYCRFYTASWQKPWFDNPWSEPQ